MLRTIPKTGNARLIAGVLVLLGIGALCKFLWLTFQMSIVWIAVIAWLVVPLAPFVLRLFVLSDGDSDGRHLDGMC